MRNSLQEPKSPGEVSGTKTLTKLNKENSEILEKAGKRAQMCPSK